MNHGPESDIPVADDPLQLPVQTPTHAGRETVEAFFGLVRLLPGIGAGVIAIATAGYVVGWWITDAYYTSLGAEWIANRLTSTDLLQASVPFLGPLFLAALLGVQQAAAVGWTEGRIERIGRVLLGLTAALLLGGWLVPMWFAAYRPRHLLAHPEVTGSMTFVAVLLAGAAAGFEIARLALALRESQGRWDVRHFAIVYFLLTTGVWSITQTWGRARAAADADPRDSALPLASGVSDKLQWRVLSSVGDRLVLVHLREGKRPWIRFAPLDTGVVIRPSE